MPKNSEVLDVDVNGEVTEYNIIKGETTEISPENHTATFTFIVSRDEPY